MIKTLIGAIALAFLGIVPPHWLRQMAQPVEICDNAIDDDGDGLIDLNDPDCDCQLLEPVSLIPNPSFEEMNCCPTGQSQLHCAGTWIQASTPTTDYVHPCGWFGWDEFPPPVPFPDGIACVGFRDGRVSQENGQAQRNWKEYAGACLLSPLIADSPYVFEFYVGFVDRNKSPTINITFFGTPDCINLPFGEGDEHFGCPTNGPGWINMGSRVVSGGAGNKWVKTTIEVTPTQDIYAIAIGPDCPPVESPISIYYFFDNLTLVDLRSYQFQISEAGHPCSPDFTLQIPAQTGFLYQWYKNGIALIGETNPKLSMNYGEGSYQVRIMDGGNCVLTGVYTYSVPIDYENVEVYICEDETFSFGQAVLTEPGSYIDTFKTINHCDSVVLLNLHVLGTSADTVQAKIFEGETFLIGKERFTQAGDYLVHLVSSQNCDSLVLLQLTYYHLFIPNAFSPNQDGVNDQFSVFEEDDQIDNFTISIFDRWGNQLYHGLSWDGRHQGHPVSPGVFTYLATLRMNDGLERQFTGSVTLIR